jgi:hypothetical protein
MKLLPFATRFSTPAADYFRTDDLQTNLGNRTARGGLYTVASMAINFFVVATSTIWLTRALTPTDFGLYQMVLVIINFSLQFVDLGLSRAVVQNPKINRNTYRGGNATDLQLLQRTTTWSRQRRYVVVVCDLRFDASTSGAVAATNGVRPH